MDSAARSKADRPSKREIITIDDDESADDQPVVKSVRREDERDPSINVVELQQELLRSKDDYERASYTAREAELRAELAEKFLASNRAVNAQFDRIVKEKVAELEKKLADALKKVERAEEREDRTYRDNRDLARENEALKKEMAWMSEEHNSRIEELTLKLDQYEGGLQVLKKLKQQRPTAAQLIGDHAAAAPVPPAAIPHTQFLEILKPFHTLPERKHHPTDIFQVCRPGSIQSVSVFGARDLLIRAMEKAGNDGKTEFNLLYSEMHAKESWLPGPRIPCEACEELLLDAYDHFISEKHCHTVQCRGAAVSWTALSYWNRKLQLQLLQPPAADQRPDIEKPDVADA